MSYLSEISIDPHLHIAALDATPGQITQQRAMAKINYLTKTRRFAELQSEVSKIKELSYPTLQKKLQEAKRKTQKLKEQLGYSSIHEKIKELQERSKNQEDLAVQGEQKNIYKLSKILYDEGKYEEAYNIICQLQSQDLNTTLWLQTTWARLYCQIMLKKQEAVKKTAEYLRSKIKTLDQQQQSTDRATIRKQYAQKEELLNILCFVYFQNPNDEDFEKFIDICSDRVYFSVIQLVAPHIFRYICAAMILNKSLHKSRSFDLFKTVQVINRDIVRYQDILTDFLRSIYIDFNFAQGAQKINKVKEDVAKDPFLAPLTNRIVENCQYLYFKVYCKVHETVTIKQIAQFVKKSEEQSELWILNYIRSGDIEAKIDSTNGVLESIRDRRQSQLSQKYLDLVPKMSTFINNLTRAATKQYQN